MFGNKLHKISKLEAKGETEKLVPFLDDKKPDVRMAAIDALGKCSGDTAFNAIVPLIHNPAADVRIHAADALGHMNQSRSRPFLEHQLAQESDKSVIKAIDAALASIKSEDNV